MGRTLSVALEGAATGGAIGTGTGGAAASGGTPATPTSAGRGGGSSVPSRAGSEASAARIAAPIAIALPALAHLILRPATLR